MSPDGEKWWPGGNRSERSVAIRTIMDAVELDQELAVEQALLTLGVNPFELFVAVSGKG